MFYFCQLASVFIQQPRQVFWLVVLTGRFYKENNDWGLQKLVVSRNNRVVGLAGFSDKKKMARSNGMIGWWGSTARTKQKPACKNPFSTEWPTFSLPKRQPFITVWHLWMESLSATIVSSCNYVEHACFSYSLRLAPELHLLIYIDWWWLLYNTASTTLFKLHFLFLV